MGDIEKYSGLLKGLSIGSLSFNSETIFGLLGLVCILLFVLSLGRTRTLLSLLAIYVAFTIQAVFPFFKVLQDSASFTNDLAILRIGVLLVAYVAVFLALIRAGLHGRFNMGETAFFSVMLMGLLQLGLIVSIILNLAPSYAKYLPEIIIPYIANQKALFVWAIVPLALLVFQKGE